MLLPDVLVLDKPARDDYFSFSEMMKAWEKTKLWKKKSMVTLWEAAASLILEKVTLPPLGQTMCLIR